MNCTDQGFPIIRYDSHQTPLEWGQFHGESYASGIKELAEIRKELMLQKVPALKKYLDPLAKEQFEASKRFAPDIADEIQGIGEGAGLSLTDVVILNNYTDFRDIELPEEGCSTLYVKDGENIVSGQTWDMHGSAKEYLCMIDVPEFSDRPGAMVLSLVGCVGLMGFNTNRCLIGVNNINTQNARASLIWPLLVRRVLQCETLDSMRELLTTAPVTSGHNYIISSPEGAEHWEITPNVSAMVASTLKDDANRAFHTNHCISQEVEKIEVKSALSSTTRERYEILQRKVPDVNNQEDMIKLLKDHEGYPKSICSHFEASTQDPSQTCGGGVADSQSGKFFVWRGCQEYDDHYKEYDFILHNDFGHRRFLQKS